MSERTPEGPRPARLVLVAGTGTEVGKTWAGAALARRWRAAGRTVAARKPAQSFEPGDVDAGITDAQLLAAATGETPHEVCPPQRWYPVPLAPPMAADALDRPPPTVADLVGELAWPTPAVEVGLVETAGGVRSPQGIDGDVVDLQAALAPDATLVVADAGLGTINAVRLTVDALTGSPGAPPIVVLLNRYEPDVDLHRRNRAWLVDVTGLVCTTSVAEAADALTS